MTKVKSKDSLIGGVVGFFFCLLGGMVFWLATEAWIHAEQSKQWSLILGEVVDYSQHLPGRGCVGFDTIHYKYEYNGVSYRGNKISFGLGLGRGCFVANVGEPVKVYVNSRHPDESVLVPGIIDGLTKMFCVAGGAFPIGYSFCFFYGHSA